MTFKVVMSDTIFPDFSVEQEVLDEIGTKVILARNKSEEAIMEASGDCDALVVTYAEITERIVNNLQKCKLIVRTGIGYNNIPVEAASKKGIMVANVPDYCWDEVSDHAMALALALIRKVTVFDRKVKSGDWSHKGATPIYGMRGQTFGLVGFGNIPKVVARKAQVFGFNVVAYDPFVSQETVDGYGVKMLSFEELMKTSDVVSVHAPLTDSTHHIINADSLGMMKPTAFLVNTARGPLVDTNALYQALKDKKIAGAALDVLEQEPPMESEPILSLNNIIITPHAAFYSEDSSINLRRLSFKEVVRVLKGELPRNFVNRKQLIKEEI